jgi:hypothetical protein
VLLSAVDAQYRFLYISVGCQGRISSRGIFSSTSFGKVHVKELQMFLCQDHFQKEYSHKSMYF